MIRMGLIGVGRMGRYHLNLYDEISDLEKAAVCDLNPETLKSLNLSDNVFTTTNFRELFDKVDAVTIAAPTKYHYEIAKECLNAGKHLLVEKPITTDYNQAVELFEIASKKNLVLHIGHVERFNGAVQEIKKLIDNPFLIESRRVGPYVERMKNDSIVLDLMIHDIDIIINLMNRAVIDVEAKGSVVYSDLPDFASVTLVFDNNAVANILVSRVTQKKDRTMSISQHDAFIYLDYTNQDINIYRKGASQHVFGNKELKYINEYILERVFVYKDNPLKMEIKHFLSCIKGETSRIVTVEHELNSLKVALAVDEILKKRIGRIKV
ncbi:Gfo/Idh/MocA family protein [Calditerrivibrio nitroreducens]|uniref:Oxidoreductase domain protein n=1 Tax=Calditerrivibrio nitroreducens (strain DSM 19672 / NBRC 101217 / Yu37-1) TaxID=768670 RepID=E4TJW7_CALNY|nr:Gfo/Idh/MocA family oxidoreductase [Calditerrivibrio nitroreducens]ADR18218.1 oxidoreductase domain protein [Calditerrivibrio nitroreducens DSM 19672]